MYFKICGGDFLNECGRFSLDLSINHLSMSQEFVVVENRTLNLLIGCDFMYRFNLVINFVNRTVSLMGSLVVAKLLNQLKKLKETVRTINHVTLKPYTEMIVCVSWPVAYKITDLVVLEPLSCSNNKKKWMARVVVQPVE